MSLDTFQYQYDRPSIPCGDVRKRGLVAGSIGGYIKAIDKLVR